MTAKTNTKYRPVLTATQIAHILTLAKSEVPMSSTSISILGSLSPFYAKIQNKAVEPAYETAPKASILESLGALPIPAVDKETYWAECYEKWSIAGPTALNLEEIAGANEHRYINGLMTAEEISDFEAGTLGEG